MDSSVSQEAVAIQLEEERLVKINDVLKELPTPHYRYSASFTHLTQFYQQSLHKILSWLLGKTGGSLYLSVVITSSRYPYSFVTLFYFRISLD